MRSAFKLAALVGGQVAAVLVLARVVRCMSYGGGGASVSFQSALAYGVPALLAFWGGLRLVRPSFWGTRGRWLGVGMALLLVCVGHAVSLFVLQRTDMWLTARYIQRMQEQLRADARFRNVRLIGYSDDFILFPYIPVGGSLASEEDRRELDSLLKASSPPAFVGARRSSLVRKDAAEK